MCLSVSGPKCRVEIVPRGWGIVGRRGYLAAGAAVLGILGLLASAPMAVGVEPAPTTTAINIDPDPAYYAEQVEITASVTPNPGGGVLRISSAGGVFDLPIDPDTGTASVSDTLFNNPTTVSAHFFGTADYAASSSGVSSIQVISVATSTALEIGPNPSLRRDDVTFTAHVVPTPSGGDVAFWTTTGVLLGIDEVDPLTGEATLVRSDLLAGTRMVWASFGGSGRYRSSSTFLAPVTHQVEKRPISLSLSSPTNPAPASPVSFELQLGAIPYAGTVRVVDANGQVVAIGLAAVDGSVTSLVASISLSSGVHILHATYGGDDTYLAATSALYELLIDAVPPSTTMTHQPGPVTRSRAARFDFVAAEEVSFSCRLDGAAWVPCSSPWTEYGLTDGLHTARIRATDLAGNVETAPATVHWTVDTSAPELFSTTLDGGAFATKRALVAVQVGAADTGSGITRVRLSNVGTVNASGRLACGTGFPFGPEIDWSLDGRCGSGADGTASVFAQVRDAAGNWSAVAFGTIILDRTAPRVWLRINGGATATAWKVVELRQCCWDGTSGISRMRISNTNATIAGRLSKALVIHGWTRPINWNLLDRRYGGDAAIGPKAVYLQLRDGAGNWSAVRKATIQYLP